MKKKLFSLILAALMLSSVFMTGCSEGTENSAEETTPAVSAEEPSASETAAEDDSEKYPYDTADYDGFKFTILVRGSQYGFWESNEMWADDMTGEVLNDAVRERILQIESMYDVSVNVMKSSNTVLNDATKVIQAAQDEYQMILGASSDVSSLAINKMAVDMNTIDSLHLDMPWWDQAANEGLSIANKLYYSTGDISYDLYRATEAVLFNKVMLGQYNLEDPYTLVREGTWTIDKMLEMSQGVSMDIDGNGTYDEKDMYGMVTYTNVVTSGIFASGIHYNTKDENDLPVLSFFNERTTSVVEKYITFMTNEQLCFDWANYYHLAADPNTHVGLVIFQENRALFNYNGIHAVPNLRNMFSDFGIVPIPKYDVEQESYYHCANNVACPFVLIPISNLDLERAGTLTDAFAHMGLDLVKVAFYDITLKSKSSRDEESAEMLDLVFDTMVYDIAFFNNFGGIGNLANEMMSQKNTNIASRYKAMDKVANKQMEKFVKDITSVEE